MGTSAAKEEAAVENKGGGGVRISGINVTPRGLTPMILFILFFFLFFYFFFFLAGAVAARVSRKQ